MDHAYTMSGSQNDQTRIITIQKHEILDDQDDDQTDEFDSGQDNYQGDDQGDDATEVGGEDCPDDGTDRPDWNATSYTVLLPTEEWMQMLPPQYLLHYIRERTVCRESGRVMRDSTAPLKRGWLQGSWRETIKDAIAKQTPIPCVINFNSSNFLKQPFSRKVGPPLWRVKACCRQDDGQCLKFHLKVQDFHPSKPHVEIEICAEGTLLEGPEGEARHTFTASDQMRALKSMQRYQASTPQTGLNGCLENTFDQSSEDLLQDGDDGEVQRLTIKIPTEDWISFLPADAADAYVLERSAVSKDRLAIESQESWSRGARLFVPRVTKECRQYLKRALADRTGLPCRIGLTGRCHLKPPFSRKKRAPLFVTNGFCGRKEHKCLRFKFTVQDFDPRAPAVDVEVEVRGQLLEGPEGEDWHSRRPTDDLESTMMRSPEPAMKRALVAGGAGSAEALSKRPRLSKRGRTPGKKDSPSDAYAEAVQALQAETWPGDFDLQTAEVVLEDQTQAQEKPHGDFVSEDGTLNAIQVLSEDGQETALGEDAARELMQLANEALSLAGGGVDGDPKTRFTATKIVQSGDQVFIFVGDPAEGQEGIPPTIEAVEVSGEELAAVVEHTPSATTDTDTTAAAANATATAEAANILEQYHIAEQHEQEQEQQQQDEEQPCMEYRWEMKLPMADWLRLLPAKSLRYYVHERTVGREVWVEEGWEKQFRCQTLQHGWRDVVRRAVVEQTDIPCQMCFRGRSSLKLPFSRKHSAALWRTQGYCSKGDRNCLIYKFCVQDFHPDDEFVKVDVYAVGKLHRDCRRWFTGSGTVVRERSAWPEYEAEVSADVVAASEAEGEPVTAQQLLQRIKREPVAVADDWVPDITGGSEHEELDPEQEAEGGQKQDCEQSEQEQLQAEQDQEQDVEVTTTVGDEFYQAVLKSIDVLKLHLSKARRCPLKMQAALRLLRNAQVTCAAPCKTPDCLCRPNSAQSVAGTRQSAKPRWRWPARRAQEAPDDEDDPGQYGADEPDQDEPSTEEAAPAATAVAPASRPPPAPVTPMRLRMAGTSSTTPSTPDGRPGWQTKVTRSGPLVLTAMTPTSQGPTIIKLSPAQIAAGARAPPIKSTATPSSSKLIKLSSAIERSALPTPAVVRPLVAAADSTPTRSTFSPPATRLQAGAGAGAAPVRGVRKLVAQRAVSSSQERRPDGASAEDSSDPSWIMEEMRRVILDGGNADGQAEDDVQIVTESGAQVVSEAKKSPARPESSAPQREAAKTGTEAGPTAEEETRPLRARVMVQKLDPSAIPSAGVARALAKTNPPAQTRVISPPSRPVTRRTKVVLASAASAASPANNPPPLVPISSKGPSTSKSQSAPPQNAGRSQAVAAEPEGKAQSASPVKTAKTPTRTVQTRLLTSSVVPEKASLPQGGKVLILRPSMPILRSSPRKPS